MKSIFILIYVGWTQGTKPRYHRTCAASLENVSLIVFKTRSSQARCATPSNMTAKLTTNCHSPQCHQKEEVHLRRARPNLPHLPEGSDTVGGSSDGWGRNIVHQWTPLAYLRIIPHIAWKHKEADQAHLRSPQFHGKLHGTSQSVCKFNFFSFHFILPPFPQTKGNHPLTHGI